ncbi:MAG: hypothetical protein M1336_00085 [Deltaproteobacteria bacterium]|nr:hypothetical protein [Deltaproteobacteria bacterium]
MATAHGLAHDRLNRVGKAKRDEVNQWREGVSLERRAQRTIADLMVVVTTARFQLAQQCRADGNGLLNTNPPRFRAAVSRYYYAMYHAMRACVYLSHGGDDHEAHVVLPQKVPGDFPATGWQATAGAPPSVDWQNKLKDARAARNAADYDPLPASNSAWRKHALALRTDAGLFLRAARSYLRAKGCKL